MTKKAEKAATSDFTVLTQELYGRSGLNDATAVTEKAASLDNEAIVGDPWAHAADFSKQATRGRITDLKADGVAFAEGTDTAIKNYVCRLNISDPQRETDLAGTISYLERLLQLAYGKRSDMSDKSYEVRARDADTALADLFRAVALLLADDVFRASQGVPIIQAIYDQMIADRWPGEITQSDLRKASLLKARRT